MAGSQRWRVQPGDEPRERELIEALEISGLLARLLVNRGVTTVAAGRRFLATGLQDLHDPFLFPDMGTAVARLREALRRRERILVHGDYDVDGLTGTALLTLTLRRLGGDVAWFIPHRVRDGYGVGDSAVRWAGEVGGRVLVTVDCGIAAEAPVAALRAAGVDTIITDHHEPLMGRVPQALAILNPKAAQCPYPDRGLSGVGLAFKLAQGLVGSAEGVADHLDLVALGTVADVSPMVGENRVLVRHGLAALAQTRKPGLLALKQVAGMGVGAVSSRHLGFVLGPRLNASGRMGSAETALRLLLAESADDARTLAEALEQDNRERQQVEGRVVREAIEWVERDVAFQEERVIVVADDRWHAGVVGIVAARLVDRYHRPAVVIALNGPVGKGSGRSIPGFSLVDAVGRCAQHLMTFGGHDQACGVTVAREQIPAFRAAVNRAAWETLVPDGLIPTLSIDAEWGLSAISRRVVREVEALAPFGVQNPRPILLARGVRLKRRPETLRGGHLRCWLTDGRVTLEGMGFRMADTCRVVWDEPLDVAYTPECREWQGEERVRVELADLQPAGQAESVLAAHVE